MGLRAAGAQDKRALLEKLTTASVTTNRNRRAPPEHHCMSGKPRYRWLLWLLLALLLGVAAYSVGKQAPWLTALGL